MIERRNIGARLDRFISHAANKSHNPKDAPSYANGEEPFVPSDSLPEEISLDNCLSPVEAMKFDSEDSIEIPKSKAEQLANTGSDLVNFASLHDPYKENAEKIESSYRLNTQQKEVLNGSYRKVFGPGGKAGGEQCSEREDVKVTKTCRSIKDNEVKRNVKDVREILNKSNNYFQPNIKKGNGIKEMRMRLDSRVDADGKEVEGKSKAVLDEYSNSAANIHKNRDKCLAKTSDNENIPEIESVSYTHLTLPTICSV
eukprot:TRINITY_DN16395_c0_g1_i3.p1 TRINITY_DN16395_c0_g1~~TRINITY_DN16395_c0_g1_i3.p1  ORF type:complete len:256 (+),score=44.43 TRINITY_DN16395_c0_g1_i3:172-939(+)